MLRTVFSNLLFGGSYLTVAGVDGVNVGRDNDDRPLSCGSLVTLVVVVCCAGLGCIGNTFNSIGSFIVCLIFRCFS